MRELILKIHMYGGLLCSGYLMLFGLSSLHFNHKAIPEERHGEKVEWERPLAVANQTDNLALSESVRDSLGLAGWPIPWETRREPNGNLRFGLARPGKHYTIHVLADQKQVRVEETRLGLWSVIDALHGLMEVPSSRLMSLWGVYTEICFWVVMFSAASGVYLWTARRSERVLGWILIGAVACGSLVYMLVIRVRG